MELKNNKLSIINGSPRGKGSNTKILMEQFLKGYTTICEANFRISYLSHTKELEQQIEMFKNSEYIILAFPLYTDAMPAIVKRFIEALEPFCAKDENPALGFVVQSGFPESIHSRAVEAYLIKLAKRLNCQYLGTIIKGGVEGIQVMPENWTKKLYKSFFDLGVHFGNTSEFHPEIIRKLAGNEKMSPSRLLVFKLLNKLGLQNFYWNSQLKKNKVFDKRNDRPLSSL